MNSIVDLLLGKFKVPDDKRFELLDSKYHLQPLMYLQKETIDAFINMHKAAKDDNIDLKIISGTRDFNTQKMIWEKKFSNHQGSNLSDIDIIKRIMRWSAMPCTSRHHWGTDIDINGFDDYFDGKNIKANNEYRWLVKHAAIFGFFQVYSIKEKGKRLTGYNEEKWHWSYMPLARDYLNQYKELVSYSDIKGFSGSEYAKDLDIINKYVMGISEK